MSQKGASAPGDKAVRDNAARGEAVRIKRPVSTIVRAAFPSGQSAAKLKTPVILSEARSAKSKDLRLKALSGSLLAAGTEAQSFYPGHWLTG
jgi:hypothetical protein